MAMKLIREGTLYQFDSIAPTALPGEVAMAIVAYRTRYDCDPLAITLHPTTYADLGLATYMGVPVGQDHQTPPGHAWMCGSELVNGP